VVRVLSADVSCASCGGRGTWNVIDTASIHSIVPFHHTYSYTLTYTRCRRHVVSLVDRCHHRHRQPRLLPPFFFDFF